jgi:carboxylesterase
MKIEEGEPYGIKNSLVRNIVKAKFERGDNFHYRWVPLACIREVDRLRRQVIRDAGQIICPTLVVHAREDELTSLKSAEFIARTAQDARVVVLENSYHMICVDNDRELVATSVLDFLGVAKQEAPPTSVVEPCAPDEIQSLVARFVTGMREKHYEDVFPLFSADIRWDQRGSSPVARVYGDRNALIDLFSQFVTLSGNTFAVTSFGEPRFGDDTVRLPIVTEASSEGAALVAHGVLELGFGNRRIRAVNYVPARAAEEDAFWSAAARAAANPSVPTRGEHEPAAAHLAGLALDVAFDKAVAGVGAIKGPLAPALMLRLRALYKQARSGDVSGERPGVTDVIGRAKYDTWSELRGTAREVAMSEYVALAHKLASE